MLIYDLYIRSVGYMSDIFIIADSCPEFFEGFSNDEFEIFVHIYIYIHVTSRNREVYMCDASWDVYIKHVVSVNTHVDSRCCIFDRFFFLMDRATFAKAIYIYDMFCRRGSRK